MANTNDDKKKRPRRKQINLCRICLTYSPSMRGLNENFEKDSGTILEVLKAVMCCEVEATDNTPVNVCSICLSMLKISYDFKLQFEDTQKKLFHDQDPEENDTKTGREVEVIFGNNNYSLDDIVILDDDEEIVDYSKLLNNLPKTVSVEYLGRHPGSVHQDEKHLPSDEAKCNSTEIVELEDEDCETIIIQYLSDTDEFSLNQDQFLQSHCSDEEVFEKDGSSHKIASFIIKDECGKEFQEKSIEDSSISNTVRLNDLNSKNVSRIQSKRKKRSSAAELKEIEKYIICTEVKKESTNFEEEESISNKNPIKEEVEPNIQSNSNIGQNSEVENPTEENSAYKHFCEKCSMSFKHEQVFKRHLMFSHGINMDDLLKEVVISPEDILRASKRRRKTPKIEQPIKKEESEILEHYAVSPEDVLNAPRRRRWRNPNVDQSMNNHQTVEDYVMTPEDVQKPRTKRRRWKNPNIDHSKTKYQRWEEKFRKNPMLCQICGHISKSSGGANYHSLTHSEKRYKCDICAKTFYTPSHLKNHVTYLHEKNMTKHLCSICGEYKNSPTALNYHMKLHRSDLKKFPCPICNISFLLKGALNTHLRRHKGERPYHCELCDKSFFTSNENKKHMMIHTGEKPYECKYCEKSFITPFNRKIHMMTHSGPHVCKICYKGLADPDMLKLHIKYKHRWESKTRHNRLSRPPRDENAELDCATKSIEYEETSDSNVKDEIFECSQQSPGTSSDTNVKDEIFEFSQQSPGTSPDNMILQVLDLLDAPPKFDDAGVD